LIITVKELHRKSFSYIIQGGHLQERFEVKKELRQGCCTPTILFKIQVEKALNISKRISSDMEYNEDNTTIYTPQFADDQVRMVQSSDDLGYIC
jgi:hypothetical protein